MACALQFIDYSHNMIEEVSASTFMALKSHLQFLDANNNRISRMPVGVFKDLVLVEVCENCVLALLLACVPCSPLRSCWHGCGSPLHSLAGTCAEQPPVVFATVAVLGRAGMCACAHVLRLRVPPSSGKTLHGLHVSSLLPKLVAAFGGEPVPPISRTGCC